MRAASKQRHSCRATGLQQRAALRSSAVPCCVPSRKGGAREGHGDSPRRWSLNAGCLVGRWSLRLAA